MSVLFMKPDLNRPSELSDPKLIGWRKCHNEYDGFPVITD